MARPIAETPVLMGKDAKRFWAKMKEPKTISKEQLEKQKKAFEYFQSISNFEW
ncbi:hypothetical protein Barb6_02344 [Bacteroidales bacterium Barb6]|nr:hypothetical protein Barb6XT_03233 [Bacteroidales bacterium Barb6XT]OAV65846.1 hypothetical protein Barb6XT_02229 [Bacteroidales bacterium Barb6XT]OAV67393.1 hypothetical protein Barb6_02344 [Bacteroidales bacterium Barb6]